MLSWKHIALVTLALLMAGCPSPTPSERITQLGGEITVRENQVIDLSLANSRVTDADMAYINALCSNSGGKWKAIHTLDLSNTDITDAALDFMILQGAFSSPSGLKVLILTGTKTTDAAVARFQEHSPNCEVQK